MGRIQRLLCDAVQGNGSPPEPGRDLWNAFQCLSTTRTYHAAGPNPIQPTEILAWCKITGLPLAPHHVDILLAMDQAWLERAYRKVAPEGAKTLPPISKTPLTAGLLDAVLG